MKNNQEDLKNRLKLEILRGSHLEHFNAAKIMAQVLPIECSSRRTVENSMNDLTDKIQKIKK